MLTKYGDRRDNRFASLGLPDMIQPCGRLSRQRKAWAEELAAHADLSLAAAWHDALHGRHLLMISSPVCRDFRDS